ncbi:MAG: hypothetical protein K2O00_02960 [Muribaculaceae bacterium]|nr:hypothetical protein [Muribaculaceae bacterium]
MRKITFILVALLMATAVSAQNINRGYRGFLEWDNNLSNYEYGFFGEKETIWSTGLSTSHGYQFNPNIFVGAGLMIERSTKHEQWTVPVFAQFRTDQTFGEFTPFGDVRLGYNMTDGGGIYFSPTVGYRFNLGRKMNLNWGVGLTLRGYSLDRYEVKMDDITSSSMDLIYLGKSHHTNTMFTMRLGIDF